MASDDLELLRGTLDLLVLKTLSWGPMHGLAVLQWIERIDTTTPPGRRGRALPRAPSHGRQRLARRRMGTYRRRPAREILSAHRRRATTAHAELSKWARYSEAVAWLIDAKGAQS